MRLLHFSGVHLIFFPLVQPNEKYEIKDQEQLKEFFFALLW